MSSLSLQRAIFNAARLDRPEMKQFLHDREINFLAYCIGRRFASRAQILQDLWVSFELGEKRNGYFVEFGSTNGVKNSNTWLLEKEYGWRGILAEPNPLWHTDLASNRDVPIDHRCISSRSGEQVRFLMTNAVDPELSAIAAFSDGDHFADIRQKGDSIMVETISLNDLLDLYDAPDEIDYISIDTEGSEFEILSNFQFGRRCIKLFSVEQNSRTEVAIEQLLGTQGYLRVFRQFSQWDGWYVSRELRSVPIRQIFAPQA